MCDDDVDPNDFILRKPMPPDLITGLQQLLDYLDKYSLYTYLDTLEKLIQYLSQSDIKLEYIQDISYMPYE